MTSVIKKNLRTGWIWAGALIFLLIPGCAVNPVAPFDGFPALADQRSVIIAEPDILAVSAEMERFVQHHVAGRNNSVARLRSLIQAVTHPGMLGFEYDASQTLTAEQAFAKRTGNCVAFANMFVALARHAGFKAYFQEAVKAPEWNEQNNAFLLAKHINVLVRLPRGDYVVDVGRNSIGQSVIMRMRPDAYAKAQYFNNLGVDALLRNDLGLAHGYFKRALRVDPGSDYIWSNLGVAYNRNGQPDAAIWAYRQALKVDKGALTAMSNLSGIYEQQGDDEKARAMRDQVERYRRRNPYYLLMLSDQAISAGRYQQAIDLLHQAIQKKGNEHRLHFALAKSLYLSGYYELAHGSYERAKALAPAVVLRTTYNRKLAELVRSDI